MRPRRDTTTGPDYVDLAQTVDYIRTNYAHACLVVMEPHKSRTDLWTVRIIATYEPRNPSMALAAAMKRPPGVTWECQWSGTHNLELSSTLFRGLFEVEIALTDLIEQLELPV